MENNREVTGTVPKTSGEEGLWLCMEGGRRSLFSVNLEQVDDKESLEALWKGKTVQVSEVFVLLHNAHKVANVVHTRYKQRVEHGCQKHCVRRPNFCPCFHPLLHGIH